MSDKSVEPLDSESPYEAQFTTIDPLPTFAVVMGLPECRWYCSLQFRGG